jgi:hypothetical protein
VILKTDDTKELGKQPCIKDEGKMEKETKTQKEKKKTKNLEVSILEVISSAI